MKERNELPYELNKEEGLINKTLDEFIQNGDMKILIVSPSLEILKNLFSYCKYYLIDYEKWLGFSEMEIRKSPYSFIKGIIEDEKIHLRLAGWCSHRMILFLIDCSLEMTFLIAEVHEGSEGTDVFKLNIS